MIKKIACKCALLLTGILQLGWLEHDYGTVRVDSNTLHVPYVPKAATHKVIFVPAPGGVTKLLRTANSFPLHNQGWKQARSIPCN